MIKDYCWSEHIKSNGYHINNCRSNLRRATQAENVKNKSKQKNNASGVTGVGWVKKLSKWRARITFNEKEIYLGVFDNKMDAIRERLKAEKKYFGEFAPQRHLFEQYKI